MRTGERIRIARLRLGRTATQKWLADQLGVTPQAISEWEKGNVPHIGKLPALRRALRVTFVWLLCGQDSPPHETDPRVKQDDALDGLKPVAPRQPRPRAPSTKPKRRRRISSGA